MTVRMPRIITAGSCVCGARLDNLGGRRCRKCRARARWRRRHSGIWN